MKFKKDYTKIKALKKLSSEVNRMMPAYAVVLGLHICFINVKTHKIDRSMLLIYDIMLIKFQLEDKHKKTRFFKETFLIANTAREIILEILFLALNKMEINFSDQEFN